MSYQRQVSSWGPRTMNNSSFTRKPCLREGMLLSLMHQINKGFCYLGVRGVFTRPPLLLLARTGALKKGGVFDRSGFTSLPWGAKPITEKYLLTLLGFVNIMKGRALQRIQGEITATTAATSFHRSGKKYQLFDRTISIVWQLKLNGQRPAGWQFQRNLLSALWTHD